MSKSRKVWRAVAVGVCLVMIASGLSGCKTSSSAQSGPAKKKPDYAVVIGTEGSAAKKVVLSNETSATITAVALKASTETTW
ncbi:MAG: hypothetical protein FWC48_00240, partial [Actinomycetia bacterium]|nr:hypothetical protein [Actinomycetes bacterium]